MNEDVELLTHGKEPSHVPSSLSRTTRSVVSAGIAVLMLAVGAVWWHDNSSRPAAAALVPQGVELTFAPAPALVPRVHQVHISTTSQSATVTGHGRVDLDLQLVNDGSVMLKLLNVRLPQPGVRADPGPGGLVSSPEIALLAPDTPTPITLHLVVLCPQGLAGQPADHLELTLLDDQGFTRDTSLDLSSLPGFWDHIRHSACATAARSSLVVDAMPTSVRWADGTNGP